MADIRKRREGLNYKAARTIVQVALVLVGVSLIVSFFVYARTLDNYYKNKVSNIGRIVSHVIDAEAVEQLLEIAQDEKFQKLHDEAVLTDNEVMISSYLVEEGVYDEYLAISDMLIQMTKDAQVEYIYIISLQGNYSIALVDPLEGILYYGSMIESEAEFLKYSTNERIPATVSNGAYGWLCSGYEPILNNDGEKIAMVGVDINMNDIMETRYNYMINLVVWIVILGVLAVAAAIYKTRKSVTIPLKKLSEATKAFVNSEAYTLDEKLINLDIHSNDEIEELYDSIKSMEENILNYLKHILKVSDEKDSIVEELNDAVRIQVKMLPSVAPPLPKVEKLDICAKVYPAVKACGDLYDYFMIDNEHLAVVMIDVSGIGVPATFIMLILKSHIRKRTMEGGTPAEIMRDVNKTFGETNITDMFATVWFGIINVNTGSVTSVNAGFEYPALKRSEGKFELIRSHHYPPVATMNDIEYQDEKFELKVGDILFLYSNGVVGTLNSDNKPFGEDRLISILDGYSEDDASQLIDHVKEATDIYRVYADQTDDIIMAAVKYLG